MPASPSQAPRSQVPSAPRARLPAGVWALGLCSLFMDMSSELIHGLLPLFMTVTLGVGMTTVGLVEGVAEATAAIVKVFSGAISDWWGRHKPLAVFGYGLAALTKPFFPLAHSVEWVFAARFADRMGKGIRGAPRDALVADIVPSGLRGAAYGLRQALDSVGAALGPLAAIGLMLVFASDVRTVLWFATIPAFVAVAVLAFGVREPPRTSPSAPVRPPITVVELRRLGRRYWTVVGLGVVLTLARFSEAFLVLRAADAGLDAAWAPAVMIVMSTVYALSSYPAGRFVDRGGARALLFAGLAALVLADVVLALAATPLAVFAGTAFWGLHMGLTQGLLAALVADAAPRERLGTAFGMFYLLTGAALLAASLIAGVLWSRYGAGAAFTAGGVFAAVAAAGLALYRIEASAK